MCNYLDSVTLILLQARTLVSRSLEGPWYDTGIHLRIVFLAFKYGIVTGYNHDSCYAIKNYNITAINKPYVLLTLGGRSVCLLLSGVWCVDSAHFPRLLNHFSRNTKLLFQQQTHSSILL